MTALGRTKTAAIPAGTAAAVAFALLVILAFQLVYGILLTRYAEVWTGHDFELYRSATQRWLEGGPFYAPYQLSGPYQVLDSEILYPPVSLVLFAPFTVLPAVLWWAIPIGVTAWVIASHRPGPWRIAAILGLLALPIEAGTSHSLSSIVNGNPVIWVVMFVALATRYPAFGPFVLLKFTLAPFALVGVRHRSWWAGLALLLALCIPFGAMWLDYLTALVNAQGAGLLYSLRQVPLVLIPLVAYGFGNRLSVRSLIQSTVARDR